MPREHWPNGSGVCQCVGSGAGPAIFLGRRGDVTGWFGGGCLERRRGARVRPLRPSGLLFQGDCCLLVGDQLKDCCARWCDGMYWGTGWVPDVQAWLRAFWVGVGLDERIAEGGVGSHEVPYRVSRLRRLKIPVCLNLPVRSDEWQANHVWRPAEHSRRLALPPRSCRW